MNRTRVQTMEFTTPRQRFDIVFASRPDRVGASCYDYPLRVIGLPMERNARSI